MTKKRKKHTWNFELWDFPVRPRREKLKKKWDWGGNRGVTIEREGNYKGKENGVSEKVKREKRVKSQVAHINWRFSRLVSDCSVVIGVLLLWTVPWRGVSVQELKTRFWYRAVGLGEFSFGPTFHSPLINGCNSKHSLSLSSFHCHKFM